MAGEMLLVNPRRRRKSRRKKARASRRKSSRRRRRVLVAINPRRRRRRVRNARRGRRRVHRNPRLPLIGNVDLNGIVAGGVGIGVTHYGTGALLNVLPKEWMADPNAAPWVRIGAKAGVGLVLLPMVAKMIGMGRFAKPLVLGAGAALAFEVLDSFAGPAIKKALNLGAYDSRVLSGYDMRVLSDVAETGSGAYGGGAYAGAAF